MDSFFFLPHIILSTMIFWYEVIPLGSRHRPISLWFSSLHELFLSLSPFGGGSLTRFSVEGFLGLVGLGTPAIEEKPSSWLAKSEDFVGTQRVRCKESFKGHEGMKTVTKNSSCVLQS